MADYPARFARWIFSDKPDQSGEWRAYCPLCEDPDNSKTPSASVNFDKGLWRCHSCGKGGRTNAFGRRQGESNANGSAPDAIPLPDESQMAKWRRNLLGSEKGMAWLEDKRGIDRKTAKRFGLGWDGMRLVIPVLDIDGQLVNIRRYKPNARETDNKVINWKGHGEGRIFLPDVLAENDTVVLCEGELDAIVANRHNIPAVTHTSGAGRFFNIEWAPLFRDKVVYICFDEDDAGVKGAVKAVRFLKRVTKELYVIKLNTGKRSGDLTDYFVHCGGSKASFSDLMEEARRNPLQNRVGDHIVPDKGTPVTVEESQGNQYNGPIEMTVMVAGKQTPPFIIPKVVKATCDMGAGSKCAICPLAHNNGQIVHEIAPDEAVLMNFININDAKERAYVRKAVGANCNDHVEFDNVESYTVEELVVAPSVEHRTDDTERPITRKVYNVGTYRTPVNSIARLVGKQIDDPQNNRALLQTWLVEPVRANLDQFKMSPEIKKALRVFRPSLAQSPLDKCLEIAHDISNNVTHIYGREILHVAYDLVWHSLVDYTFLGNRMDKGWLECLVIGDTRTGKSEAAQALTEHYDAGIIKSCENASLAGLVGGAQQINGAKNWMITWGALPLNDRRLVVLDELSGLISSNGSESRGIFENMSSIRSSGRAQLTKIATEETSARTRLIWISNPIDGRRLEDMPGGGMDAIRRLIKNPEDIARFDYAIAVANNEVPSKMINTRFRTEVPHVYTAELCSQLVMWAWSRKSEDVWWMPGAEDEIISAAERVGRRYASDPPLVQIENIRIKLARLAVAIAARTFSTDKNGRYVMVKPRHITSAVEFLDMIYGSRAMGYLKHSDRVATAHSAAQQNIPRCVDYLKVNSDVLVTLQGLRHVDKFKVRDFEEFAQLDRLDAQLAVRQLLDLNMLQLTGLGYMRMTPTLVQILNTIEEE